MPELHIPAYNSHRCVPTEDAYQAAVDAAERHKARSDRLAADLTAISVIAARGLTGYGAMDALKTIQRRAEAALTEEN